MLTPKIMQPQVASQFTYAVILAPHPEHPDSNHMS
jgi:hypothetical protein